MSWTDTITTTTRIRSIHISELRNAINNLKQACATHNSADFSTQNTTVYGSNRYYDIDYGTYWGGYYSGNDGSQFSWRSTNNSVGVKGVCFYERRFARTHFSLRPETP
ncbi:hypothetical protein [Candidatus Caldatribacterium sp.]|uniref:hypothetical protein n=1 Tax=Candidatus Caldatribacterium sp. TaxID=2282143 RepID=UPI003840AED5|nr:hypothetical protein [Candidatus Caldatribacterium sp.]